MVLDVFKNVTIDGKEYKLGFPNKVLYKAERELSCGNLIRVMAFPPPSMGDIFVLFKYALIGGGHKFTEEEYDDLFNNAIAELGGYVGVSEIILAALELAAPLQAQKQAQKQSKKAEAREPVSPTP
ncbi:MAG: hypothetical protein KBS60_01125 [Phascolarctobacterium sp.]|nr:hypothetical protein [Candidatus Phascolarctobacterium caballi]